MAGFTSHADAPPPSVVRPFLMLSTAVWLLYGIFLLFQPDFLNEAAGISAMTATGRTEIRAMYGGLQAGLGLLCLAGCMRRRWAAAALTTLLYLCGGLFTARLIGTFIDGDVSSYTTVALVFEFFSTVAAAALRSRIVTATA